MQLSQPACWKFSATEWSGLLLPALRASSRRATIISACSLAWSTTTHRSTTYASPRGIDIGGEDPASRARPNARTQSAITEVLPRLVGRSTWYGQSLFANFRKGATAIGTGAGRCPSCHHRSARSSVRRRDVPPALRASNRRLTSLLFPAPVKADNTHPPKIIRPRL